MPQGTGITAYVGQAAAGAVVNTAAVVDTAAAVAATFAGVNPASVVLPGQPNTVVLPNQPGTVVLPGQPVVAAGGFVVPGV
jgi:hypothetical protein